jgi:hypothetical protein
MIDLAVNPESIAAVTQSFAEHRRWLIAGVIEGMGEAMQDLALATAENAPRRTGALERAILKSVKVKETSTEIVGTVSGNVGSLHVGLWLEEGTSVPAVVAKMVLIDADGQPAFIRRHRAFRVPPHPFMNPTLQAQKQQIFETLRRHIRQAAGQ